MFFKLEIKYIIAKIKIHKTTKIEIEEPIK